MGWGDEAARVHAPDGTTAPLSVTTSASTAQAIVGGKHWTFKPIGARVHIRFGDSAVGNPTTANDFPINDGEEWSRYIKKGFTHYKVIGADNATLYRYPS